MKLERGHKETRKRLETEKRDKTRLQKTRKRLQKGWIEVRKRL